MWNGLKVTTALSIGFLFAALPATTNYKLNSYGFGSGGTANSQTTTYSLEGTVGELSGQNAGTVNAQVKPGYIQTQQANVPKLAALDNNGGQYYNKLHFVIDAQNNPTDAKYLVAVSTDNFVSNISYVQTDGTLSSSLTVAAYRTYSAFGGSAGSLIIGLTPSTTYSVKLRATQGAKTESAYGPSTSQATAAPSLSFSLLTSNQASPPYSIDFGVITAGNVNTSTQSINTTLSTNGTSGANVYITSKNGGLKSGTTGNQINAVTNNLASLANGFGGQTDGGSIGQTSGGPYSVVAPYNVSGTNVGIVGTVTRSLYTSTSPVTGGNAVLRLLSKASSNDVAANDYQDVLTFTAAGNF